jgi:hypothetical protein
MLGGSLLRVGRLLGGSFNPKCRSEKHVQEYKQKKRQTELDARYITSHDWECLVVANSKPP